MQIGVYCQNQLIHSVELNDRASTQLPLVLRRLLNEYDFDEMVYVNSPGSFMALKIAYVTLQTLHILKNIPLKAVDGFVCNNNKPIKAIGKIYFVKEDGTITTKKFQDAVKQEFVLPVSLNGLKLHEDTAPKYEIAAV